MSEQNELDSEFFREAVADAKTIRETAIENAKDHLEEAFTPKLQSMLSQTIQQEMEGEEDMPEDEEGGDDEVELDLSDLEDEVEDEAEDDEAEEEEGDSEEEEEPEDDEGEDDEEMEEITDQDELNLGNVMEFLEAAAQDDRHTDPDTSDDLSDDNVTYDDAMLDTDEFEDGYESDNKSAIMDDVNKITQELEEETELKEELEDEMVEAFLEVLSEEEHDGEHEDEEEMEEMGDYEMMDAQMDMENMDMEDMSMGEFMDMANMDMEDMKQMMGGDYEMMDGDYEMMDHGEEMEESTVFDIDLNEFGVTGTTREPMSGVADVSGPYDTETDDGIGAEGQGVQVGAAYDDNPPGLGTGEDSGTEDLDQPLEETIEYDLSSLLEDEDTTVNEGALREQNQELKQELSKHRQAIKILREKINETNLINSKLLYTNRLFKNFNLNDRQKMNVIENFDRASNAREAKLVYTTIAESFNDNGAEEQISESRKSGKKQRLVEALEGGLGSEKTGGSTTPSEDQKQILNENDGLKDRFQKLANI